MSSFSVVIPSYNGKEYLRQALHALEKSEAIPSQVIVVDDASTDGTAEMINCEFNWVRLLVNNKNKGPTASRNRGAAEVKEKHLVFLDNDIKVRPESIGTLLSFMERTPDAGLVGGKLINEKGDTVWWNMGHGPNFVRTNIGTFFGSVGNKLRFSSPHWERFVMFFNLNFWAYDRSIEVGWVVESFNAIPRKLFEEIGGFDEEYFMFFEGPDLSKRLLRKGHKTYFVHDSVVDMLDSHAHTDKKRQDMWRRGSIIYFMKHYFRT